MRFALAIVVVVLAGVAAAGANAADDPYTASSNPPWYPSLQGFEHDNSARSHVFSKAQFRGSLRGPQANAVKLVRSRQGAYSSGYNMSWLNAKDAFIQGGSYGNVKTSNGPFVAKVDPQTLKPVWSKLLRNTKQAGEWDYPGSMFFPGELGQLIKLTPEPKR